MSNYIGSKCPICKEKFTNNDDIVVCPHCGAPYHRSCYKKDDKCLFEDKHSSGYVWKDIENNNSTKDIQGEKYKNIVCPNCKHVNDSRYPFCIKCGAPILPTGEKDFSNDDNRKIVDDISNVLYKSFDTFSKNEKISGITIEDFIKFIQTNFQYYIYVFKRLEKLKIERFSLCGFLFHGGWMLYRKQYKLGSILTAIYAAISILLTYISYNYSQPLLQRMFNLANVDMMSADIYTASNVLYQQLYSLSLSEALLLFLPSILFLVKFAIMLFVGLKGNRLYYNHCVKKINSIKSSKEPDKYKNRLTQQGGVNIPLAISLIICYIIINYLPNYLI